jgi:hypothetical protein
MYGQTYGRDHARQEQEQGLNLPPTALDTASMATNHLE